MLFLYKSLDVYTDSYYKNVWRTNKNNTLSLSSLIEDDSDKELLLDIFGESMEFLTAKTKVFMLMTDGLRVDYVKGMERDFGYKHEKLKFLDMYSKEIGKSLRIVESNALTPTWTWDSLMLAATGRYAPQLTVKQSLNEAYGQSRIDSYPRQAKLHNKTFETLNSPIYNPFLADEADHAESHSKARNEGEFTVSEYWMRDVIIEKMENGTAPDLYLAHLDMIDKYNHMFSPLSDRLSECTKIVDKLILEYLEALPEDTTLVMHGDHGGSEDGSHGQDK